MYRNEQRTFLFETTEICLRSSNMEISTGKKHFTPQKIGNSDFGPPHIPTYATAQRIPHLLKMHQFFYQVVLLFKFCLKKVPSLYSSI